MKLTVKNLEKLGSESDGLKMDTIEKIFWKVEKPIMYFGALYFLIHIIVWVMR